jgi:hypothetical protein
MSACSSKAVEPEETPAFRPVVRFRVSTCMQSVDGGLYRAPRELLGFSPELARTQVIAQTPPRLALCMLVRVRAERQCERVGVDSDVESDVDSDVDSNVGSGKYTAFFAQISHRPSQIPADSFQGSASIDSDVVGC